MILRLEDVAAAAWREVALLHFLHGRFELFRGQHLVRKRRKLEVEKVANLAILKISWL